MEERRAREERQRRAERAEREEQERLDMERMHAEAEARELEQAQRRMAEQQRQAAGAAHAAPKSAVDDSSASIPTQAMESSAQRRQPPQQVVNPQTQQQTTSRTQPVAQTPTRASRTTGPQQAQQASQFPGGPNVAASGDAAGTARGAQPRNTFPHAFERWEALSAHWEGLTSFWIRKLQQHADDIDRDPVSSQLSRQVSDLSAAGANLFHAVVELQRLRASSERKFQRWFFETRAELERHEETKAALERALAEERRSKANAIQEALENDRSNSKTQKRIVEMQKELIISKEEARRAWEELGRREQEERDRTISLQQGLPTIVGGVQVVPMTQGVPSRGNNAPDQRQQPEATSPQDYPQYSQPPPGSSTAAAPGPSGGYYEQPQRATGEEERPYSAEGGSEGGFSEGEYLIDAHGNFIRDSRGDKIPYPGTPDGDESDSDTEEYETPMAPAGVPYPPSASHQWSGQPDYSGSGYAAPGWDTMPRHHHPTRLSDVIEEDETRSRTSASQSQVGRH